MHTNTSDYRVPRRSDEVTEWDDAELLTMRGQDEPILLYRQMVGKRLYINALVRFLVAAGLLIGAPAAAFLVGNGELHVKGFIQLGLLLLLFNSVIFFIARRHRHLERRDSVCRYLSCVMHITISTDFLFLTIALWLSGGAKSPFLPFYLIHVILAMVMLTPRAACFHALFGYALLSGLILGQYFRVVPAYFPIGLVNSAVPLNGIYVLTQLAAQAAFMIVTIFLMSGLTRSLRRGELELRTTNLELQRLSKIHRDFLHVALHDMKAPINAVTMLVQSMRLLSEETLTEQQRYCLERMRLRLREATDFLHDFTVLAEVDSVDMSNYAGVFDLATTVRDVAEENRDMAGAHRHTLEVDIEDGLPSARGIDRLIHESVANLVTNAIKYTPDGGRIQMRARRKDGKTVRIEVEDNGIGISWSDQRKLFQEFVRIKRDDDAFSKVPGSGLGLSIVRRIVEGHGGKVGLESEPDKGSTFFIELPVAPEQPSGPLSDTL